MHVTVFGLLLGIVWKWARLSVYVVYELAMNSSLCIVSHFFKLSSIRLDLKCGFVCPKYSPYILKLVCEEGWKGEGKNGRWGYGANTCFVARDVSEKYQSQIHPPLEQEPAQTLMYVHVHNHTARVLCVWLWPSIYIWVVHRWRCFI